jgi:hypothetical protein
VHVPGLPCEPLRKELDALQAKELKTEREENRIKTLEGYLRGVEALRKAAQ